LIVYVNGDSNSAGAEAVKPACFAEDDPLYWRLGRQPHPDNLAASYGCELANRLGAILDCDAESASSNDRIMRTTRRYLENNKPDLLIIGWATWEREEWLHDGTYYQVTASGTDAVPPELAERYRNWVIGQTTATREDKMLAWHQRIYQLHLDLETAGIRHVFFNCFSDFANIASGQITTDNSDNPNRSGLHEWNHSYIGPYDKQLTYYQWLTNQGFQATKHYHFLAEAHRAWADYLYEFLEAKPNSI